MPLINGCKYSCEPCIRGHRATSCAHTDRILIEVRKPGRPLESCGHNFNTCQCGRVAELFNIGDVLPSPAPSLQQPGTEPDMNFVAAAPPVLSAAKTRRQLRSMSRVRKKSTSKRKGDATMTSSPGSRNRGSRETSALTDDNEPYDTGTTTTSSPVTQDPNYASQQQPQGPPYQFQQTGPYLPSVGQQFPPMQMQNEYLQYQGAGYGYAPPPQQQYQYQSSGPSYSSRIEDVTRSPEEGQGGGRTEVRSQYIVATQDSVWRAAP